MARRGARNLAEFFVGGRAIPWWLAATSMAATTFNVDTPLYVAGRVAQSGVAGNWEWWCFAFAHVLLAVLLAKLWRRAQVMTDMELTELRYGGRPAAALRAARAFLFAVPLQLHQHRLRHAGHAEGPRWGSACWTTCPACRAIPGSGPSCRSW